MSDEIFLDGPGKEILDLQNENRRLREALEEIANRPVGSPSNTTLARNALKETP